MILITNPLRAEFLFNFGDKKKIMISFVEAKVKSDCYMLKEDVCGFPTSVQ